MRVAAKTQDDVGMHLCMRKEVGVVVYAAPRNLAGELAEHVETSARHPRVFCVDHGHVEKGAFDQAELLVLTAVDPLETNRERPLVPSERSRRPPPEVSRELVEKDHERKAPAWSLAPIGKAACEGFLDQASKARANLGVDRFAPHPPKLFFVFGKVELPLERAEPIFEHWFERILSSRHT